MNIRIKCDKMKYDFDKLINRKNTGSIKWDGIKFYGNDDLIPMWIADMDFPVAEPIKEAIKERANHLFYGYQFPDESLKETIIERAYNKFNWKIEKDWIVFTPGVISGINIAIRTITHPGDSIIIQEPVYHLFPPAIKNSGCHIVNNPLKFADGNYKMDYDNLKEILIKHKYNSKHYKPIKGLLFCNPHNPVGRVWKKEEIIEMGKIAIENGLTVISDEIHSELIYKNHKHVSFASISKEFEQNSIICLSPSKTFNLAGLHVSSIIIPNKKLRDDFIATMIGITPAPSIFSLTAFEAGFKHGDEWLEQLLEYLEDNLNFMIDFFKEDGIIEPVKPEGTYLTWLNCRNLNIPHDQLKEFFINEAKVVLEDGKQFGESGEYFMRMNIAIPRSLLKEALERIKIAIDNLN
jgi:cystathionine beta-lyase